LDLAFALLFLSFQNSLIKLFKDNYYFVYLHFYQWYWYQKNPFYFSFFSR
jgi:hypothetical protein